MTRAKHRFSVFALFNTFSFTLLGGNLITLYALKLEAGNFLIGLLSSFVYLGNLFMLLGLSLIRKHGVVRLMGRYWMIRYLLMLPVLLCPLGIAFGWKSAAHALLIFGVFGFNAARGIAITSWNPIIGIITQERERGAFLSWQQVIVHSTVLGSGILMALILGASASPVMYALLIALGVLGGVYASSLIFTFPEPGSIWPTATANLWQHFQEAFRRRPFRRFMTAHFLTSFLTYMVNPFLIVYFKNVYLQPDSSVLFFTVFGSLGAVVMALLSGFIIDRMGAKPLYFINVLILSLAILPTIASPQLPDPVWIWIFAAIVFFFHNMGNNGALNAGQAYLFSAITSQERLTLSLVYYLFQGLGGGLGALAGGALLQSFQDYLPLGSADIFRLYFGLMIVLAGFLLFVVYRMENLGAYPILDTLSVIFSLRDLRALSLVRRLNRSRTQSEERHTLRALAESPSDLSISDVLQRLRSPRFAVRTEALGALERLPLDRSMARSLISEVKNHAFTTAYLAAEILGKHRVEEAKPTLRRAMGSKDYFLSGKCMVALARLHDRESIPAIEEILRATRNPRLIIHGAMALEIFKSPGSILVLLERLAQKASPYVRDEIILSLAGILDLEDWFYPIYSTFLDKSSAGLADLEDYLKSRGLPPEPGGRISELLEGLPQRDRQEFSDRAHLLLGEIQIRVQGEEVSPVFQEAVLKESLLRLDRFCFLVAAVIVRYYGPTP